MNAELRDVLGSLDVMEIARGTGLRCLMHGVSAEQARPILGLFLRTAIEALSRPVVPDSDGWMPIESAPLGDFLVSVHGWVTAAYRNDGEPIKSMSLHEPFMFSPTHWRPLPAPPAARSAAQPHRRSEMTPTQEPARAGDLLALMREVIPALKATGVNVSLAADVERTTEALARHLAQPAVPDGDWKVVGWLDAEGYVWQADARAEGIDFMRRNDKDPSMRPVIAARSAEEK